MTKKERQWLIWGTVDTLVVMVLFLYLMSDYSPFYHRPGSNTEALIEALGTWQDSNEASSELIILDSEDVDADSNTGSENFPD